MKKSESAPAKYMKKVASIKMNKGIFKISDGFFDVIKVHELKMCEKLEKLYGQTDANLNPLDAESS